MSVLFISTDNIELHAMLENMVNTRRLTDSGFDIPMLHEHVNLNKYERLHTFELGIKVAAMKDNVPVPCLLLPRSSLAGSPYRMANSIGLIDSGYRGEVKAKVDVLVNDELVVGHGTRLFQICSHNFLPWDSVQIVRELPAAPDNRGAGGFGSTG
jgi:dUTPase